MPGYAALGRVVGIFPEGERGRAGEPGGAVNAGRWLRLFAGVGAAIVPPAVAEVVGTLALAFGPPLSGAEVSDPMPAIRALYRSLQAKRSS